MEAALPNILAAASRLRTPNPNRNEKQRPRSDTAQQMLRTWSGRDGKARGLGENVASEAILANPDASGFGPKTLYFVRKTVLPPVPRHVVSSQAATQPSHLLQPSESVSWSFLQAIPLHTQLCRTSAFFRHVVPGQRAQPAPARRDLRSCSPALQDSTPLRCPACGAANIWWTDTAWQGGAPPLGSSLSLPFLQGKCPARHRPVRSCNGVLLVQVAEETLSNSKHSEVERPAALAPAGAADRQPRAGPVADSSR